MIKRQAEIFCNIGTVITSSLNPKEVFKRVMKIIGDYFSPRNWSLLLMEENTGRLRFEIAMGGNANKLKKIYIENGEGIVGWVCQNGKPVVVEDAQNDPRFSPRMDKILGFTTRSVICVPLLNGSNRVVGAIELINKIVPPSLKYDSDGSASSAAEITPSEETFTEVDMKILSSIGTFTGIAAENAFLHQKVKEMSMIDPLTGINNRLYFNEMLHREKKRVIRYNHTICMLMIDVDGFKKINDTYGHLTGDKVLQSVADILKSSVRDSDILARFGGDEFVIIMPLAVEREGHNLADRIRTLINQWNAKQMIPGLKLSVSIGVHASGKDDVNNLLLKADDELYRDKNSQTPPEELTSEEQIRRYLWHDLIPEKQ